MAKLSIEKLSILQKDAVGDGVSLQRAHFSAEPKDLSQTKYRIVVADGLFPAVSFSTGLRKIFASGVKKEEIAAVDFRGKLEGDLKQFAKNFAKNVLGDKIKVHDQVSKKHTRKQLAKEAKDTRQISKNAIKTASQTDCD